MLIVHCRNNINAQSMLIVHCRSNINAQSMILLKNYLRILGKQFWIL